MESIESRFNLDGSHAAPMHLVGDDADSVAVANQEQLSVRFEQAVHFILGPQLGDRANFVANSIRRRMSEREGQNSHSFITRRHRKPWLTVPFMTLNPHLKYSRSEVEEAVNLAQKGSAEPLQAHIARRALGMSTIEDANLTMIGEARRELRDPMHYSVEKLARHAISFGLDSMYRVAYLGSDAHARDDNKPSLIRVGYKSHFSTLSDGAVLKGRTTAIIDVSDHRLFNPSMIQRFDRAHDEGSSLAGDSEFTEIVQNMVGNRFDPDIIVAENETIYEADMHRLQKAKARRDRQNAPQKVRTDTRSIMIIEEHSYPVGDPRRAAIEQYGNLR